jgi:hypothetical protein
MGPSLPNSLHFLNRSFLFSKAVFLHKKNKPLKKIICPDPLAVCFMERLPLPLSKFFVKGRKTGQQQAPCSMGLGARLHLIIEKAFLNTESFCLSVPDSLTQVPPWHFIASRGLKPTGHGLNLD